VSCLGVGARTGTFTVKPHLVPAKIAVVQSGLTQVPNGNNNGTSISYGLVLVNRSPNEDASGVSINITLIDTAGNAVAAFGQFIVGSIRAGTTFYTGGNTGTIGPTTISHLAITVTNGSSPKSSETPPELTNLQLSADPYDGTVALNGEITNEATAFLSSLTEIDAVVFNKAGKIVGGGGTGVLPGLQALPPGGGEPFEIDTFGVVQASNVAQAKVSVAPFYGKT
jgi:hypothetical protein